MTSERVLRIEVASRELLDRLATEPGFPGVRGEPATTEFFRELFFDTVAGDLDRRGVGARLTVRSNGVRTLAVDVKERESEDGELVRSHSVAEVQTSDPEELLRLDSEPARLLRSMLDPARLTVQLELETARRRRTVRVDGEETPIEMVLDAVTLRRDEMSVDFYELEAAVPSGEQPVLEALAEALRAAYGLRVSFVSRMARAREILERVELDQLERQVQSARQVAVVARREAEIALLQQGDGLRVPLGRGWGENACRKVLREAFGDAHGRVRLLGTSSGFGSRPALEVWLAQGVDAEEGGASTDLTWLPLEEALERAGSPSMRDAPTLTALHMLSRAAYLAPGVTEELRAPGAPPPQSRPFRIISGEEQARTDSPAFERRSTRNLERPAPETLLNMEVSELAFQERVLALAEDSATPLLERVRFLSILGSNLDQFFRTRVAGFHKQLASGSTKLTLDGMTPEQQLEVIGIRVRDIFERAYSFLRERLLPELEREGISILQWDQLAESDREYLEDNYAMQLAAVLTPLAADPSHPFPHIRNLRPALAVIVREPRGGAEQFAAIELPGDLPRFVPLPGGRRFIPIEEVIRASLPDLYRGQEVVEAHVFRVTRSANISIDEDTPDLLQAVQEKLLRRPLGPVVRLEVEQSMPAATRERLLRELQFASGDSASTLTSADLYPIPGLVDLFGLEEIAELPMEELHYPPLERRRPLDPGRSVWEILSRGDVLVRFPYETFEDSVERLLGTAATDDRVVSVKITLYRTSKSSNVVRFLRTARRQGKDVLAVVELKASFDEQRNIEWARKLESAGIHVVYGPPQLKVHAKVMLIVRREEEGLRRYMYIGTGNLNAATAAAYTDLGLLTVDESLGEELQEVFNGLTGYSAPTEFANLLVAPFNMRERFLELIEREVEHATSGRGGRIRVKINGLTDPEIISALYRASRAGVRCELVVRGLCSLRPGVPGLSENISVRSILGRFLEHARIYEFSNAGEPEYFIGSADWRPRNLSRRVEIVAPVRDPAHQAVLRSIIDEDLANPDGWVLHGDGSYHQGELAAAE